jgi:hypothetical protein
MPELGKYGSVRGALSNGCLYRDWAGKGVASENGKNRTVIRNRRKVRD